MFHVAAVLSIQRGHSVSEPYSGVLYILRRAKPAISGFSDAFHGVIIPYEELGGRHV